MQKQGRTLQTIFGVTQTLNHPTDSKVMLNRAELTLKSETLYKLVFPVAQTQMQAF